MAFSHVLAEGGTPLDSLTADADIHFDDEALKIPAANLNVRGSVDINLNASLA
ncbi:MAG: hypothetical protein ACRDSJ_10355 [Rubrobacteraceae bacterium]